MPDYIHYKDRPERIKEINKNYYDSHREEIAEYMRQRVMCECGCEVCYAALCLHKKSKRHIKNLEKIQNITQ
jgi:hypothetical protein